MGVVVLAAQSATLIVLSPLVLGNLGAEAFGVWSLGSTILAFATLLDLGIGEATAQRVGELGGANAKPGDVARIMSEATRHYRRMAAAGFAGAPVISLVLVATVKFEALPSTIVFAFFLCASSAFFLGLPSYARAAILVGRGETWAQRIPLLVESLVIFIVSLIALSFGLGLLALGVALLLSRAVGALVRGWVFNQIVGTHADPSRSVSASGIANPFVSIRGAALPFLLMAVASRFEIAVGPLLLATRVGADEVGPYIFVFRCFFTLLQITWQVTDHLFPTYRRLVVEHGWESARRLTEQSLAVTLPFVALASCLGAFVYDGVVAIVAPGLVVGPAVTSLLALFAVTYHTVHLLAMGANGSGLQQRVMPVMVASAAAGFGLGLGLVGGLESVGIIAGLVCASAVIALPGLAHIWSAATSGTSWRWLAPVTVPALFAVVALVAIEFTDSRALAATTILAITTGGIILWNLLVIQRGWSSFRSAVRVALTAVRMPSPPAAG